MPVLNRKVAAAALASALITCATLGSGQLASAATATTKAKAKTVSRGIVAAKGRPPSQAAPFLWDRPSPDPTTYPPAASFEEATTKVVPNNKLFTLLVIGSDARPKEKIDRSRADSIHLFVWNPAWNQGIIVGFPRDAYVAIPGKGTGKINSALTLGGPALLMATVNGITKKPTLEVERYAIAGFTGFAAMVDEIGGVNVLVDPSMNDATSGARFGKGWHAMNGKAALAFSRNRKTVAGGDFGRSLNQGRVMLYGLAKLREEVSDASGLVRWIQSFRKNGSTNVPVGDLLVFSQIVRSIDPVNVQNFVLTGKTKRVSGTDVVVLDTAPLVGFMEDISRDAVNNGR